MTVSAAADRPFLRPSDVEELVARFADASLPTTPTRGYHETITRFYLRVVRRYLQEDGRQGD